MGNYILRRLVIAISCVIVAGGCSRDSKRGTHLKQAGQYFSEGAYDKAEIEYKNALRQGPAGALPYARLGEIYLDQGRILLADYALKTAANLDPQNTSIQLKLGYLQLAVGQFKEAHSIAGRILEKKPDDPEAPLLLAETAGQAGNVAETRTRLNGVPETLAKSAPIWAAKAILDLRDLKLSSALAFAEKAAQADPKNPSVQAVLGRCQLAQKDVSSAEKSFAAAAELAPLRSPLRLLQVQLYLQTGRIEEGRNALAGLMRQAPDFLPAFMISATLLTNEKKYDESLALLDKVLAREANHLEALLLSAQNRAAKGEFDKALAILEHMPPPFRGLPNVQIQLGQTYFAKGDLANAANSFTQAISTAPSAMSAPTLLLAQVQLRQDKAAEAIVTLKSFLQKNPRASDAQLLLAEIYHKEDKFEDALAIYRQFAQTEPNNAPLQLIIGTILERLKKGAEARAVFEKVQTLAPDQFPTIEHLTNLDIAEGKLPAAKARVDSYIEKRSTDAAARILRARVLFAMRETAKGEDELKKAIDLQPDSPVAYLLLAQYYVSSKQVANAIANLEVAGAKNNRNPAPFMMLAVLHSQEKNYAAAAANYEKVIAINPKAADALNNLASLYSEELNEPAKAMGLAERARALIPNSAEAADTLGWVLYKAGQFTRAEALLSESAERLALNPEVRYHFGMASYMIGNEESARTSLEAAVNAGQTFSGIDQAKEALSILAINPAAPGKSARTAISQALARRKDDPVALARLAALDQRDGKLDEAFATYENLLQLNPGSVQASLGLISIYQARNQRGKALELGRALRKSAPSNPRVAATVGRLAFESGEYAWALGLLQDAARRFNNDPEVLFDLGVASYSMGLVDNAEIAFKSALQAAPTFPRAAKAGEYLELIRITNEDPTSSATVERIDSLLKSDSSNVPALMAKASLEEKKGNIEFARSAYEKALARYPDFIPAKRQLAIYYSKSNEDVPKGLEFAMKARESLPNDPQVAKALGILMGKRGNHDRAISLLKESARSLPQDGEILFHLGMAQLRLKQSPNAKSSLQRAIDLGLPNSLALEARRSLETLQ